MREITLPETKPALEWINGRVVQKVSPRRKHALAQTRFAAALDAWAEAHGTGNVGTEWEFRVAPTGEDRRPLVPDVAYVSFERLPFDDGCAADIPRVAPNAIVEVLSPGDSKADVEEKVRVYLAAGTDVVFLVDTDERSVAVIDGAGRRVIAAEDTIRHESLPGFALLARALFEGPRPKR